MTEQDTKHRCRWCNLSNSLYVKYHDEEWGRPLHDDQRLFEMLILECFQAGLSWECVLNKREAFRKAFDGFEVEIVSNYNEPKVEALLKNKDIIRNRLKINASITNAKVFLQIQKQYRTFDSYIWSFTQGKTIYQEHLTSSPLSDTISKDLKKRGMKFVGTTIIYAYLEAIGILNTHEKFCYLHRTACSHHQ